MGFKERCCAVQAVQWASRQLARAVWHHWRFLLCLGGAGFAAALVTSYAGWQFATAQKNWWDIVAALGSAAAAVMAAVAAGLSLKIATGTARRETDDKESLGRVAASAIYIPVTDSWDSIRLLLEMLDEHKKKNAFERYDRVDHVDVSRRLKEAKLSVQTDLLAAIAHLGEDCAEKIARSQAALSLVTRRWAEGRAVFNGLEAFAISRGFVLEYAIAKLKMCHQYLADARQVLEDCSNLKEPITSAKQSPPD